MPSGKHDSQIKIIIAKSAFLTPRKQSFSESRCYFINCFNGTMYLMFLAVEFADWKPINNITDQNQMEVICCKIVSCKEGMHFRHNI